jgi:hypothetical protein
MDRCIDRFEGNLETKTVNGPTTSAATITAVLKAKRPSLYPSLRTALLLDAHILTDPGETGIKKYHTYCHGS